MSHNQHPFLIMIMIMIMITNRVRGPYWRILARGRGSTDRAQRGPYKTTEGQYSPVWLELGGLVSINLNERLIEQLRLILMP